MRERILAIMKMKKLSVAALVAAVILVIGVTVGFTTSEKSAADGTAEAAESTAETAQAETVNYKNEVPIIQNPIYIVGKDVPTDAQFVIIGNYRYTVGTEESEREIVPYSLDEVELSIYEGYEAWKSGTAMELDSVTLEEQYPGITDSLLLTISGTWTEDTQYFVSLNGETAVPMYIEVDENATTSGGVYTDAQGDEPGDVWLTGNEAVAFIEENIAGYEMYGVAFERTGNFGNLYWYGKLVAALFDDGPDNIATINSTDRDGGIYLRTIYDEDGNLTGVEQIERRG